MRQFCTPTEIEEDFDHYLDLEKDSLKNGDITQDEFEIRKAELRSLADKYHLELDLELEDDYDAFEEQADEKPWTDEDEAALEEWEVTRRERLAERLEY